MRRASRKHLTSLLVRAHAGLLAMLILSSVACAAASNSPQSGSHDAVITQDEIEGSHQPTLFDVVRALRPNWLRVSPTAVRGNQDVGITVYLDTQRAGGLDVLRQLPSTAAASLRFYGASEAQSRFGLGNLHGVIQIVSAHAAR